MPKQTILVVSPKTEHSKVICDCLERAGYRVLTASLGRSALEAIREQRPDLALLDWKLPDLSSLAVIRAIRAEEAVLKLPIILRGADMREEDLIRGLEAGADVCLQEPFQPQVLIARMRALLRRCCA